MRDSERQRASEAIANAGGNIENQRIESALEATADDSDLPFGNTERNGDVSKTFNSVIPSRR
jgi:hypothetical protein